MSAYLRAYNGQEKLLFDATQQCYILQTSGTVKLNPASSNPWSGMCAWQTITVTADSIFPPLVFLRSSAPVMFAATSQQGDQFTFTIYSDYNYQNEDVEYFVFCTPKVINNNRMGVFALWDASTGNKTFDTANKHMVVHTFNLETGLSFQDFMYGNSFRSVQLTSGRRYAATTMLMGGWHDFFSSGGTNIQGVWRYLFKFRSDLPVFEGNVGLLNDSMNTGRNSDYTAFQIGFMIIDLTAIGM